MIDCKHKNKYTERIPWKPGIVFGGFYFGRYRKMYEAPETLEKFITWCSDCGKQLKILELPSPFPKKKVPVVCQC